MKKKRNKKFFSGLFALALLATTAFGVAESKKSEATMSDLAMANVEALAFIENNPEFKYFGLWLECFNSYGDVIGRQYKCYQNSQGLLDSCTDIPC